MSLLSLPLSVHNSTKNPWNYGGMQRLAKVKYICRCNHVPIVSAGAYIFFSEHMLVLASHMPPCFWQSASVLAFDTSPANAGPVTGGHSECRDENFHGVFSLTRRVLPRCYDEQTTAFGDAR